MDATKANRDPTFRNFDRETAARYAAFRSPYPDKLFELVIDAHVRTGGKLDTVLDIGCGPGTATRQLAIHFQHAVGADPGEGMIETARNAQPVLLTASEEPVRFEICTAEDIDGLSGIDPASVDLITAATAAHWFDLPRFYVAASKVLKSGGSIIFWTLAQPQVDPQTTPNAAEIQKVMLDLREEFAGPYKVAGNRLAEDLYASIDLPWTIEAPDTNMEMKSALEAFDEAASWREVFNENGKKDDRFDGGYLKYQRVSFARMMQAVTTQGPFARWREAHKEQIERGEVEDCIVTFDRVIKETMAKVPGGDKIDELGIIAATGMVVIKKK